MFKDKQVKNNSLISVDYRFITQPNAHERAELKARLYKFSNQSKIAKVFKTTTQNVYEAFKGNSPTLMNKLKTYIENFESRKNGVIK